jgi:hypothetical protein
MAPGKPKQKERRRDLDCVDLGSECRAVVSADPLKPLTLNEATAIIACYRALVELGIRVADMPLAKAVPNTGRGGPAT